MSRNTINIPMAQCKKLHQAVFFLGPRFRTMLPVIIKSDKSFKKIVNLEDEKTDIDTRFRF